MVMVPGAEEPIVMRGKAMKFATKLRLPVVVKLYAGSLL